MALDLSTRSWGEGPRSILLLHGIGSDAAGWWRLGSDLADRGWTVTAPDLRGHGESPSGEDYRLESYAEDVLQLAPGWDAVLGHSLGGAVAVSAASRNPEFGRCLILEDPALLMAAVDPDVAVEMLMEPFSRPQTVEAVLEANPGWHPEDARIKAEAVRRCRPEAVERTVRDNPDWNLVPETAALAVPTLIVGGDPEAGGIVPVTVGEWFAAEAANVDFAVVSGAGHSIHREIEHYDEFLAIVERALEG